VKISRAAALALIVLLAILSILNSAPQTASPPLDDVLDIIGLDWTLSDTTPWFVDTNIAHYGSSSMKSGPFSLDPRWIQARINGPGHLSFWWRDSSPVGFDFLECYIDGVMLPARISGQTNWVRQIIGGMPPIKAQWFYNGQPLDGATNLELVLTNVQSTQTGAYSMVASNGLGTVSTRPAALTVLSGFSAPVMTGDPHDQEVPINSPLELQGVASGVPDPIYQWFFHGVPVAGATNSTLRFTKILTSNDGVYWLLASNAVGTATSRVASVTVLTAPVLLRTRTGQVWAGEPWAVWAAVRTNPAPSLQWFFNGAAIPGATNTMLLIPHTSSEETGPYSLTASSGSNQLDTASTTLTVLTNLQLRLPLKDQIAFVGGIVEFGIELAATEPLAYSWTDFGRLADNWMTQYPLPGQTEPRTVLTNVQPSDTGVYTVTVTGAGGSLQSSANLFVFPTAAKVLPIRATGWNRDVILENGLSPFAQSFDGEVDTVWFEAGLMGHMFGLPSSGLVPSRRTPDVVYRFQPYDRPNVLWMQGAGPATLKLEQPSAYRRIAVLASSG
jgi:hypothetical protein